MTAPQYVCVSASVKFCSFDACSKDAVHQHQHHGTSQYDWYTTADWCTGASALFQLYIVTLL